MSNTQFACIVWIEEDQYSLIPTSDILGTDEVSEGDEATVAWRVVGKTRKIETSWYEAKILKYSGESYFILHSSNLLKGL